MKRCRKCGEDRSLAMFGAGGTNPRSGFYGWCRECSNAYMLLHKKARKYYPILFERQGGVCRICCQPETARDRFGHVKNLATDIDYDKGWIRGLLCQDCNMRYGWYSATGPRKRLAFEYYTESNKYDIGQFRVAA